MENLLEFLRSDNFLIISFFIILVLLILVIFCVFIIFKIRKDYIILKNKIGNGSDLDIYLKNYLEDVKEIKRDNSEIKAYYTKLDSDLT